MEMGIRINFICVEPHLNEVRSSRFQCRTVKKEVLLVTYNQVKAWGQTVPMSRIFITQLQLLIFRPNIEVRFMVPACVDKFDKFKIISS